MTRASVRPPYHYYYTFTTVAVVITVIGLLGGEVQGLVAAESWPSELAEFANLQQPSMMYNYLDAPGTVVSSPVALGDEWVVVATTRGVFGMRSSTPTMAAADDDDRLPFHDADALGVTSLFAVGKSRVIAIAHRRVLLYGLEEDTHVSMEDNKTSSTIVRRLASHECPEGYTFDLHSSHSHGGVVPVPVALPAAATSNNNVNTTTVTTRMMIVLGTGMLSSPPHHQEEDTPSLPRRSSLGLPTAPSMEKVGKSHGGSLVYAFDVMTLSLLWVTTTHYDVTNYPIRTSCSQFVWLLAQNYGPDGLLGVNPFYVIRVRKQDGSQSRAALDFNTTYRGTFITMSTESDSFLIVCPSGGFVTGGPLPVADRAPSSPPQMDDEPEHHHNRYEQQRGKKSVDVGSLRYAFHRQSIPSCSTLPSPPFVIHGRWYIPCGEYIHRLSRRVGFADAGGGGETWANKPTSALLPEPIMQIAHRRDKGIIVVVTAYNAYLVSAAPPPRLRRQSSSFDDDQDQSIMLEHHETDVVSFLTNLDLPTKRHVCTGVTIEVTPMVIPPAGGGGGGGGTGDASPTPHSDEQPMSVVAVLSVAAKTEAPIDAASGYVLVVPCAAAAAAAAGVRSKSFPKIKMSSGLSPIGPAVLVGGRVFTASAMRPAVQGYSLESGASSSALPVKATVARNSKIDVRPTLTQFHTKHVISASIAINASSGDVFYATASMLYKRRQALNAVFEPWLMFPRFVDDVTTQMLIIGSSVVIIDTASNIVIVATSSSSSPTAAAATVVGRIIVDALICVLDSRIAPQQLGQVVVLSCDPLTNPLGSPRYYVVHAVSGFVSTLGIIDSHDRWHSGMIGSTRHFCSLSQGSLLLAATSRSTLSAYLMTLSSSSSRRSPSSIALEKHWEFYEGSMTVLAAPVGWRRGWFFIANNDETGRVALLYMQNQGSSGAATTVLDLTSVSGGGGGGLSGAAVNKWKVLVVEGSNATTTLFLLSRHGVLSYTVHLNSVGSSSSSSFHVSPLFHYKHPRRFGTIRIQVSRGGPTVVRSRSASSSQQVGLIFLDSRGFANTVFGGSLAWRLEVRDDVLRSALFVTDMRSNVFLPHGRRILGVDLVTGIITSATSWGAEPVHSFAVLSLRTPRLQPHALVVGDSRWGTVFGLVVRLTRVPVELSDSVLKQLTDSGESSKGQWPIQATTDVVVLLSEHCQRARTTSSSSTPSQHEGKNLPFGQQQHRTQPAVLMAETRPDGSISNGGGHVLILCVVLITIMLFFQARRVVVWAKSTWHSIRTGQFRKYLITKTTTSSDVDARGDGSAKEEDPRIALHHLNGPVVAVHAV